MTLDAQHYDSDTQHSDRPRTSKQTVKSDHQNIQIIRSIETHGSHIKSKHIDNTVFGHVVQKRYSDLTQNHDQPALSADVSNIPPR